MSLISRLKCVILNKIILAGQRLLCILMCAFTFTLGTYYLCIVDFIHHHHFRFLYMLMWSGARELNKKGMISLHYVVMTSSYMTANSTLA